MPWEESQKPMGSWQRALGLCWGCIPRGKQEGHGLCRIAAGIPVTARALSPQHWWAGPWPPWGGDLAPIGRDLASMGPGFGPHPALPSRGPAPPPFYRPLAGAVGSRSRPWPPTHSHPVTATSPRPPQQGHKPTATRSWPPRTPAGPAASPLAPHRLPPALRCMSAGSPAIHG